MKKICRLFSTLCLFVFLVFVAGYFLLYLPYPETPCSTNVTISVILSAYRHECKLSEHSLHSSIDEHVEKSSKNKFSGFEDYRELFNVSEYARSRFVQLVNKYKYVQFKENNKIVKVEEIKDWIQVSVQKETPIVTTGKQSTAPKVQSRYYASISSGENSAKKQDTFILNGAKKTYPKKQHDRIDLYSLLQSNPVITSDEIKQKVKFQKDFQKDFQDAAKLFLEKNTVLYIEYGGLRRINVSDFKSGSYSLGTASIEKFYKDQDIAFKKSVNQSTKFMFNVLNQVYNLSLSNLKEIQELMRKNLRYVAIFDPESFNFDNGTFHRSTFFRYHEINNDSGNFRKFLSSVHVDFFNMDFAKNALLKVGIAVKKNLLATHFLSFENYTSQVDVPFDKTKLTHYDENTKLNLKMTKYTDIKSSNLNTICESLPFHLLDFLQHVDTSVFIQKFNKLDEENAAKCVESLYRKNYPNQQLLPPLENVEEGFKNILLDQSVFKCSYTQVVQCNY